MAVKKEVFEKVGFLNEKYFLYYEDNEYSQRVKRTGYKVVYTPKAVLWHKNAGSAGGSGSNLQDYYITRNRLLFGLAYAPLKARLALLRESFKLLIAGRYWQKRGVLDFYLRKFNKGSYKITND
jgi:GT2 family glycosyltransferase